MTDSLVSWLASFRGRARRWPSILWTIEARVRGLELAGPVEFLGRPIMVRLPGSTIRLGKGSRYASSLRCNPLCNPHPCVLRTLASGARVEIGPNAGLSSTIVCAAALVTIGEGTVCGAGAMIIDTDFHLSDGAWGWTDCCPNMAERVIIGRGCFIGARAMVLKGVTIGDRAVIGAGAVVTHDVPPGAMAAGNPARIIRSCTAK